MLWVRKDSACVSLKTGRGDHLAPWRKSLGKSWKKVLLVNRDVFGNSETETFQVHVEIWVSLEETQQLGGFKRFIFCHPYLGKIPILTNIFQRGWNHQLVKLCRFFGWWSMIFNNPGGWFSLLHFWLSWQDQFCHDCGMRGGLHCYEVQVFCG